MKCMILIKDGKLDRVLNAVEEYARISGAVPLVRGPSGHWDSLLLELGQADLAALRERFAGWDVELKLPSDPDLSWTTT